VSITFGGRLGPALWRKSDLGGSRAVRAKGHEEKEFSGGALAGLAHKPTYQTRRMPVTETLRRSRPGRISETKLVYCIALSERLVRHLTQLRSPQNPQQVDPVARKKVHPGAIQVNLIDRPHL
jgi:hypothetical protein